MKKSTHFAVRILCIFYHFYKLLVVLGVVVDRARAVDLLQQNDPHQMMGKGHFGKAQLKICK